MPTQERINEILNSLTEAEKDAIYRRVWYERVIEDINTHIENTDDNLSDETINKIAHRYVYNGDYDCNQSYWDNLDNLINEEK